MLGALAKEHHAKQVVRKELQEKRKSEALVAANNFTQAIVGHLNT
uniref:Biogenesis of lysosome-related organelles complex 1 subunit 1 n=1 Tax=Plectus sambesii TaxID=2011161 RepID=A0A914VIS9_9BILA